MLKQVRFFWPTLYIGQDTTVYELISPVLDYSQTVKKLLILIKVQYY